MEGKRTLYRDTDNKMLGGVASGLAEHMGWDVTLVRLAFVFCLFAVQGSVLAYIIAWIIIPSKGNAPKSFSIGLITTLTIRSLVKWFPNTTSGWNTCGMSYRFLKIRPLLALLVRTYL